MSSHASEILSFFHCRRCSERGKRTDRVSMGLIDPLTLRIWCERCNMRIGDFTLAKPIAMQCDHCGEPIGPDHVH